MAPGAANAWSGKPLNIVTPPDEDSASQPHAGSARTMMRLDAVTKRYPGQAEPAVADLSLSVQEGETFAFLGPSGCGKTTTLRMIAGLETPDAGSIYLNGRPVVIVSEGLFVPPEKRRIGMVFQSYAIWPHMTVEENVSYPLRLRRLDRAAIRDRVQRVLDLVGLRGYEKQPAPNLSGGQQQRVALARALVYEPSLLLLDEPFSNLDSKLREQMRVEVKLLQARLMITVLLVTHDQVEALSLSDRLAVMDKGRVQQIGRPRDLYEHPANAFVRDFLGKTVILGGRVEAVDPTGRLAVAVTGTPDCIVRSRPSIPDGMAPGDDVFLAMRPEDLILAPAGGNRSAGGSSCVRGTVETALFVGERIEYRINVQGQGTVMLYGNRRDAYAEGDEVWLAIPAESATIWPA